MVFDEKYFMKMALQQATLALENDEVPIGAIVTYNDKIIGKGYNQVEQLKDVTAHAEMIALTAAMQAIGAKHLTDCVLYVTLEPCMMCAGAIQHSRIAKIYYGASDIKSSFSGKLQQFLLQQHIIGGVMEEECKSILIDYFKNKRDLSIK